MSLSHPWELQGLQGWGRVVCCTQEIIKGWSKGWRMYLRITYCTGTLCYTASTSSDSPTPLETASLPVGYWNPKAPTSARYGPVTGLACPPMSPCLWVLYVCV